MQRTAVHLWLDFDATHHTSSALAAIIKCSPDSSTCLDLLPSGTEAGGADCVAQASSARLHLSMTRAPLKIAHIAGHLRLLASFATREPPHPLWHAVAKDGGARVITRVFVELSRLSSDTPVLGECIKPCIN